MSNDSSTGGYLVTGITATPLEDANLVAFLQGIIVGVTGLPGTSVVPRWQQNPVNQPAIGTDWIAFGIMNRKADTFAFEYHTPGTGDYLMRNEEMEILLSFYGSNADSYAGMVRDGLQVGQNREQLQLNNMALIDCGDTLAVPALMNNQWVYRLDMPLRIRRAIVRTYPILEIASASGVLNEDMPVYSVPFSAHQ